MPMRKNNTRGFNRRLYAGELQTITLLKRDNDQKEGTVTAYVLYDCRCEKIHKRGQPIQGDMSIDHQTIWHIPSEQLRRVGVNYINVLDRFVDKHHRFWQPESGQLIVTRLFENQCFISCCRVDPPSPPALPATTGI